MKTAQILVFLSMAGCFGGVSDPARHYYTLYLNPLKHVAENKFPGLVRIRDLEAESAYDRFQIVVRHSPFELTYRQREVWAVKPNRMISDLLAHGVMEQALFSGVTRELGDRRPNYNLKGDLHAIEIYDSDDVWFAHLSFTLQLSAFNTGETLWYFNFDERKQIASMNFSVAVRTLSELLSQAVSTALLSLENTPINPRFFPSVKEEIKPAKLPAPEVQKVPGLLSPKKDLSPDEQAHPDKPLIVPENNNGD